MTLQHRILESTEDLDEFQLRPLDVEELAAFGLRPEEGIDLCLDISEEAYSIWIENELLAVWGWRFASFVSSGIEIWMLTTPLVEKYKKAFVLEAMRLLAELEAEHGSVAVRIWVGHTQAKRLATRLGFKTAYISKNELYAVKSDWSR